MSEPIDLDVAVATARALMPGGPAMSAGEAADVVAELRALALEAEKHVRDFTGMATDSELAAATVVDRTTWVANNVEGMRTLLAPLLDKLAARRPAGPVTAVTGRVAGAQVGAVLAFLGTKVLGQYEPFVTPPRLTLVAPNIVEAERALGVEPRDFRLWVCLHESTHRTQFTAVPWMREHLESEIAAFIAATDLDAAQISARLRAAASAVVDGARGRRAPTLVELVTTEEQRACLERITALMTLLEGHAEHVMDEVGPQVVPSVDVIRERFTRRRERRAVGVDRILRRLLSFDAKLRQYAEGRVFVDSVVASVGAEGFNRVWESPARLPTGAEIADPGAWVARVVEAG